MVGSGVLEVIIGLIFIYSLFSILVTQINTILSNILNLRAKNLRYGIQQLINDEEILARIFAHPLIRLTGEQSALPGQFLDEEEAHKIVNGKINHVDWIAPKTFVSVLMGIIRTDSDQQLFGALLDIVDEMPPGAEQRALRLQLNRLIHSGEGLDDLRETIDALSARAYRDALNRALDEIDDEIVRSGLEAEGTVSMMSGLRNLRNPYLETALNTILATSETIAEAESRLEEWFDEGMKRASAKFSQIMQGLSLIIGFGLAMLLNVDTLHIARTFWEDPALRAAVAVAAQETARNAQTEIAGVIEGTELQEQDDESLIRLIESLLDTQGTINQLLVLRLPLGWYAQDQSFAAQFAAQNELILKDSRNLWNVLAFGVNPNAPGLFVSKVIGIAITTIAIAQGAPFWFNILRKIMGHGDTSSSR